MGGGTGGAGAASGSLSARYHYPPSRMLMSAGKPRPTSGAQEETFDKFRGRTCPTQEDLKENIFDKSATDPFRHDTRFMAGHISLAPPEDRLEIKVKDRRSRPL